MFKTSIPFSMNTVMDEANLPQYLDDIRRCGAERVFICGMGKIYANSGRNYTHTDAIARAVEYFHNAGIEVGFWLSALGHGSALTPELTASDDEATYVQITDISGTANEHYSNCPLDQNFVRDYCEGVRRLAEFSPDLIMLDDDIRLIGRKNIELPCFCPLHLKEYYKRIGEVIPRDELEKRILTGGKNKYRSELFSLLRDTMVDFIKALRSTIDSVNPDIRLGFCDGRLWDMLGTDLLELAKIAAGKTKPFARTSGAPYGNVNIIPVIEDSRQQYAWGKDSGVELFAEGDTWPRPRHNVPSKILELFDFLIRADGTADGMLAYLEDYHCVADYERSYVERFVRNQPIRDGISALFRGKKSVGVHVFTVPHKAENWELDDTLQPKAAFMMWAAQRSRSSELLSSNSIPTSYAEDGEYPLFIMGENARYVDLEKLNRGAILDIPAAKILESRGVDTGLLNAVPGGANSEYYHNHDAAMISVDSFALFHITCKDGVQAQSVFRPSDTPASYRYENTARQRFYVLAVDIYKSFALGIGQNFLKSYYRQADLVDAIEWMAGKPLPAFSAKNPNLYILASKGEDSMSVALANVWLDDVYDPEIKLDKTYSEIRFVNCSGRLEGDRVYLSDIPPYGFAAFEVK